MLNKAQLIIQLTLIYSDLSPTKTPLSVATETANAIDAYTKTGKITIGTLSSTGTGNLGSPVNSVNTTGGTFE